MGGKSKSRVGGRMKAIQEKILCSFTEQDWNDVKEGIKELIVRDFENLIEDRYIFNPSRMQDVVNDNINELVVKVVEDWLRDNGINIEKMIRNALFEEIRGKVEE